MWKITKICFCIATAIIAGAKCKVNNYQSLHFKKIIRFLFYIINLKVDPELDLELDLVQDLVQNLIQDLVRLYYDMYWSVLISTDLY